MSKLKMVCIVDQASGLFQAPFSVPHVALAVRSFREEVNRQDEKNQLYMHADDFDLMQVGEFDPDTGVVTPCEIVRLLRGRDAKGA